MSPDDRHLWRLTVENSPVGMCLVGLDGRWLSVNEAMLRMMGYSAEDFESLTFQQVTHPDDLDDDMELLQQTLSGERDSYRLRKRYRHADGSWVVGDLSVALVRDNDGEPLYFISQILDVTAEVEATIALNDALATVERERLVMEAIFESVDVGLSLMDADGQIERANRKHHEFAAIAFPTGVPSEENLSNGLIFGPDGQTRLVAENGPVRRIMSEGDFDDARVWIGDDPVTRRALSVSGRLVRDADGVSLGAALSYKDVTELVRALQVKDEFVASVSHELRTPLTSVLGHLEILNEDDTLAPDVARQLQVIERNANRLHSLVADLLQVVRNSESGGLQVHREDIDVVTVVREGVDVIAGGAAKAGLHLTIEAPEQLRAMMDSQRLLQIVDNLVSNAVKYTEPGGSISVSLALVDRFIEFVVSDTGLGIAEEEVGQLFSRFFRGAEAQMRHIPGTGLGLNILRAVVSALGGDVSVESAVGVGSTFTVRLPYIEP